MTKKEIETIIDAISHLGMFANIDKPIVDQIIRDLEKGLSYAAKEIRIESPSAM